MYHKNIYFVLHFSFSFTFCQLNFKLLIEIISKMLIISKKFSDNNLNNWVQFDIIFI